MVDIIEVGLGHSKIGCEKLKMFLSSKQMDCAVIATGVTEKPDLIEQLRKDFEVLNLARVNSESLEKNKGIALSKSNKKKFQSLEII